MGQDNVLSNTKRTACSSRNTSTGADGTGCSKVAWWDGRSVCSRNTYLSSSVWRFVWCGRARHSVILPSFSRFSGLAYLFGCGLHCCAHVRLQPRAVIASVAFVHGVKTRAWPGMKGEQAGKQALLRPKSIHVQPDQVYTPPVYSQSQGPYLQDHQAAFTGQTWRRRWQRRGGGVAAS